MDKKRERILNFEDYMLMCKMKLIAVLGNIIWGSFSMTIMSQPLERIEPPIMGWSSWNTYRVNINAELICKQADAMVAQGLKEVGYSYVNIDDGFFGYRDKDGIMHFHDKRFPYGLKPVADYIHLKGLKAGIYSDAGSNTCGSIWDNDSNGIGVGLYGFERQDADLYFNKWGFDFIKIDYCGAGQQLNLDERLRYTKIIEAIREVCPRDISVNICRWAYPGTWVKELARSWRISPDIAPEWASIRSIIQKNLYLSAYAGGGHYNDMDMLEIGRGLTRTEEEVHFGMWCIMSSPLLIGCDLTTIPEFSLKLLKNKELIALNQDPLGLQAYVVQHVGEGYILVKDIEMKRGCVRAIALYNPSEEVCSFTISCKDLELGGKVKVRDLIKGKDEGIVVDKIAYNVPPRGVKILRLEGEKRLEPFRYEAEQAYLNQFDDLGKRNRGVAYMPYAGASGGMVVTNLGGERDNYAEWKDVYSEVGGAYDMCIAYVPSKKQERQINDRRIEVEINGNIFVVEHLEKDKDDIEFVHVPINLNKGYNVVRILSHLTWTPDIDCFTLERKNCD